MGKFTIFKDFDFSAGHFVRGHTRGCQNLHGHNYRVRVHVSTRELDELGMVMDFADLKALLAEVVGRFDHQVINDHPPFDVRNTTAELIAQYVFDEIRGRLPMRVGVERVEVWETPTSCAIYEAEA